MSYATVAEFVARFGEREVRMICDRLGTGEIDELVVQRALDEGFAELNGCIGVRYLLPLPVTLPEPASSLLKNKEMDIARYRLTGTEVMETEAIRNRYKDALMWAKDVAAGKVTLGDLPLAGPGGPAPLGGAVASRTRDSEFAGIEL